ncbi:MAG: sigma-70 family RNA polymerase sigma factor [Bacteroidales bacterium]|nr:sigma-70 family RNA polymerase sigma factor [Bacteroidales bacterium]
MKEKDTLTSAFVRLRYRLHRIASGILGDSDDADDALQDAFCRLWAHRERIKTAGEAEAMSVTTVHNVCIDFVRRNSRSPMVGIDESRDTIDDNADDALQREHILDDVQRIIAQNLSPQQRIVLDLREVQGLSFEAIAEMLSMQPAAVRMTLSRARKTIREIYLNTSDNE